MPIEVVKQVEAQALTKSLLHQVWQAIGQCIQLPKHFDVSLVVVGDAKMKRWNNQYRGVNAVTDVLSFPYTKTTGEVVLCYPQAKRQAQQKQQPVRLELAWLIVHGILHVLGYDHETDRDAKIMRPLEQKILHYV